MRRGVVLALMLVAVPAAFAASWPGPPRSPAPRLSQAGPPPAWLETRTQTRWLAFSSYCWSTAAGSGTRKAVCADMIPPQSRTDLSTLRVRAGEIVRIHLAFAPRTVHLTVFRGSGFRHFVLAPRRTLNWQATASGIVTLDVQASAGDASYLIRLAWR